MSEITRRVNVRTNSELFGQCRELQITEIV